MTPDAPLGRIALLEHVQPLDTEPLASRSLEDVDVEDEALHLEALENQPFHDL